MKTSHIGMVIDVLFKGIEWLLYIGFSIIAMIFMKNVLEQYQAKNTFMGQSLEDISELPTIIICLDTEYAWDYSSGFLVIQYGIDGKDLQNLTVNQPLFFEETNETVILEQFSEECYRLNSSIESGIGRGILWTIKIIFQVSTDFVPESVKALFTSEENSYGEFNDQWFDGQVFKQDMRRNHWVLATLRPMKFTYLNQEDQCGDETFLYQWMKHIKGANFLRCPKKCTHYSFLVSDDLPLCGWTDDDSQARGCASIALLANYKNFTRPCNILEYSGQTTYDRKRFNDNSTFLLRYQFSPPEKTLHFNERYVFDAVGMIGSVGGTLGMCIGFSFSGLTSAVLSFIKSKIMSQINE